MYSRITTAQRDAFNTHALKRLGSRALCRFYLFRLFWLCVRVGPIVPMRRTHGDTNDEVALRCVCAAG